MRRTRVYIAGPYSKGDSVLNTRAAINAATALLNRGFVPFVPHMTMLWHIVDPQPYEKWLEYDFEWVRACDAMVRLDGESSGADREVKIAVDAGIPVYWSLDQLCACERPTRER